MVIIGSMAVMADDKEILPVYAVGIRRVYLGDTPLWLVVSRRQHEPDALNWYLTNVAGSRKTVMMTVMHASGLRWRVEEYHSQIKQDYHLEQICLMLSRIWELL